VPAARLLAGTNMAVLLFTITVPATGAPPAVRIRVKLAALSVEFVIASEKVADTEEFSATPAAALAGDVSDTVGGVVSEVVVAVVSGMAEVVFSGGVSCPLPAPQPNRLKLATSRAE
jgi:hypothetical protein